MEPHRYIADPALSIARGIPLAQESALGELTLPGFIEAVTARFPEREALVEIDASGQTRRWTYAQLWEQCQQVARALIACGLGKGERVAILMTNRPEFISAVFGTSLAGGVAVPLSTFSTASELSDLLDTACCSILLMQERVLNKDFVAMLGEIDPDRTATEHGATGTTRFGFLRQVAVLDSVPPSPLLDWRAFLQLGDAVDPAMVAARAATVAPADPAMLFFSSGSTARPKGILSAHRGVAVQLWRMGPQQGLPDGVRSWTANGFFWSGNFAMIIGGTLACGGSLVLQATFDAQEALALIAAEGVNFLFAWPHQWTQLVEAPNWHEVDLSALTHIDRDSPIARHPTVNSQWIEPRHCYGNTESFTLTTAYPADTTREEARDSHGLPLPGVSIKIVDPISGVTVPVGERGEIAVKGPTLMLSYIGTPLDETLDDQGYFCTGDGGYLDTDGRLFWEGRLNDIIKTGGANVSPVEVDEVLRDCPGVGVVQTVGVADDELGEMVVSCVVISEGASLDEATVKAFARERLASYKTPRRVLFFDEDALQLTGSAKIKTADLRALAAARLAGD